MSVGEAKHWLEDFHFDMHGLTFALAALGKPVSEALGKTFGSETITGLDAAIGNRESVVEIGRVGEIAHAELVEPIERAGFSFAADEDVDRELLGVHASILAGRKSVEVARQRWLNCETKKAVRYHIDGF